MEGGGCISKHLTCTDAKAQSPCNYSKRQRKNTDRQKEMIVLCLETPGRIINAINH